MVRRVLSAFPLFGSFRRTPCGLTGLCTVFPASHGTTLFFLLGSFLFISIQKPLVPRYFSVDLNPKEIQILAKNRKRHINLPVGRFPFRSWPFLAVVPAGNISEETNEQMMKRMQEPMASWEIIAWILSGHIMPKY